jgi:hypothetical protein
MLSVDESRAVLFIIDTLTLVGASIIKSFWNLVFVTIGQKPV